MSACLWGLGFDFQIYGIIFALKQWFGKILTLIHAVYRNAVITMHNRPKFEFRLRTKSFCFKESVGVLRLTFL